MSLLTTNDTYACCATCTDKFSPLCKLTEVQPLLSSPYFISKATDGFTAKSDMKMDNVKLAQLAN